MSEVAETLDKAQDVGCYSAVTLADKSSIDCNSQDRRELYSMRPEKNGGQKQPPGPGFQIKLMELRDLSAA